MLHTFIEEREKQVKFHVKGIELKVVRNKIFLPWIITYCIFSFAMLFLFLRYRPHLMFHLEKVLFAAILYLTAVFTMSIFQYTNRHKIKLFTFELNDEEVIIESDDVKKVISLDDIKEVQYRSGKFLEVRGFSIKTDEGVEGVSCFGDRLNLSSKTDILQFDDFFSTFEENTKLFLRECGSEYGKISERIRLKRK